MVVLKNYVLFNCWMLSVYLHLVQCLWWILIFWLNITKEALVAIFFFLDWIIWVQLLLLKLWYIVILKKSFKFRGCKSRISVHSQIFKNFSLEFLFLENFVYVLLVELFGGNPHSYQVAWPATKCKLFFSRIIIIKPTNSV